MVETLKHCWAQRPINQSTNKNLHTTESKDLTNTTTSSIKWNNFYCKESNAKQFYATLCFNN